VVQVGALFLLKTVLHFNYLAATAIAVEAAVVHNFVWHEWFTWGDRVRASWSRSLPRLLRFNLTKRCGFDCRESRADEDDGRAGTDELSRGQWDRDCAVLGGKFSGE